MCILVVQVDDTLIHDMGLGTKYKQKSGSHKQVGGYDSVLYGSGLFMSNFVSRFSFRVSMHDMGSFNQLTEFFVQCQNGGAL